jgi:hypothetical protein
MSVTGRPVATNLTFSLPGQDDGPRQYPPGSAPAAGDATT